MALTDEDVREILRIVDESSLAELRIETEGFALHVLRGSSGTAAPWPPVPASGGREAASPTPSAVPARTESRAPGAASEAVVAQTDGLVTIASPMLGTFYRAEGPGQAPFVEVGSQVEADATVCIIEVMKMMNSVPAGVAGTIVEVCPQNAGLVEFGAPLFRVRPA